MFKWTAGSVALGAAALELPPQEMLPPSLLPYRVLIDAAGRAGRAAMVAGGVAYDYKIHLGEDATQEEWNAVHERAATRLVFDLAEPNGGMWLKWSQGLASMSHMVPKEFIRVCSKTQDDVSRRPFSEIKTVLEREYGRPIDEVFESLDETPMAAASVAQVHRGRLKASFVQEYVEKKDRPMSVKDQQKKIAALSGQDVAIKVQYIDIADRFEGDIQLINTCLKIAGCIFPGYDWSSLINRAKDVAEAELNFHNEASNANRCREDMAREFPHNMVTTPTVVDCALRKRVYVTEFIEGAVKGSDAEGMKKMGLNVKQVGTLMASAFAYQLFVTGHVHGDPHPSNVFVRQHPDRKKGTPQVVILDHGLYQQVSQEECKTAAQIWTASTTQNDEDLKAVCRKLDLPESSYELLAGMFLNHSYRAFSKFKTTNTPRDIAEMEMVAKEKMAESVEIIEQMPPAFAMWLRALLCYRATHVKLNPGVSRYSIMLRYSLEVSHGRERLGFFGYYWAFLRLYWQELQNDLIMGYAHWKHPELMKAAEGVWAVG